MGSATLNSSWQFHADREPGTKKAFTLSLVAHLLLLALLTMGISWKTSSPAGLEVSCGMRAFPLKPSLLRQRLRSNKKQQILQLRRQR